MLPVAIAHIVMAYEKLTSSDVDSWEECAERRIAVGGSHVTLFAIASRDSREAE